jgi:hypothetical protein
MGTAIEAGAATEVNSVASVSAELQSASSGERLAASSQDFFTEAEAEVRAEFGSSDGSVTRLYHGGQLENGIVSSKRSLWTTTERSLAEAHAAAKGGKVYRFDTPTNWLNDSVTNGLVETGVDSYNGAIGKAFNFPDILADLLNDSMNTDL